MKKRFIYRRKNIKKSNIMKKGGKNTHIYTYIYEFAYAYTRTHIMHQEKILHSKTLVKYK